MADLVGDVRFALRSFLRSPLHALVTVLILGVGLGSVTLMFSALNAAVLRPLPYPEPDRLVWTWKASEQVERNSLSWDDFRDFRDGMTAVESLGAIYVFNPRVLVTGTDEAERAVSSIVTPGFFATLGVAPALGRSFLPQEAVDGGPDVVILSHAYWQSRMGGDPAAVGRTLALDGRAAALVTLLLAAFGLYGVLAYLVAQRRHEIGIRMAVGASGSDTVALVVREGMRMVGVGVGAGLLGGWALAMVLRSLLFEMAPADPLTFAAVTTVLSVVALAASLVPALRAVRVSPPEALRAE